MGIVLVSALQGALWTLAMGALRIGQVEHPVHTSLSHRVGQAAGQVPVWVFQSIAAFPMRGDATNPSVYVCYLLLFGGFLVAAGRAADRRLRAGLLAVVAVSVFVPVASTTSSYDAVGIAWQGRYGLPFAVGSVVLGGYALDRSGHVIPEPVLFLGGLLFVVSQTVSLASTLHVEIGTSPLVHSSAWLRAPLWLAIVVGALGAAVLWWGPLRSGRVGGAHG